MTTETGTAFRGISSSACNVRLMTNFLATCFAGRPAGNQEHYSTLSVFPGERISRRANTPGASERTLWPQTIAGTKVSWARKRENDVHSPLLPDKTRREAYLLESDDAADQVLSTPFFEPEISRPA